MKDKKAMYIHFTIHHFPEAQSSALNTAHIDFLEKMGHLHCI